MIEQLLNCLYYKVFFQKSQGDKALKPYPL